jgi:N-formylglutamate amidohydrolase
MIIGLRRVKRQQGKFNAMRKLIIHIPHSSTRFPEEYKEGILLAEDKLKDEIFFEADLFCDELFGGAYGITSIVSEFSRMVCDVERFRDDAQESSALNGQGLFYTHTMLGEQFRQDNPKMRQSVLEHIYDPHHERLTQEVTKIIEQNRDCLIVDCHSFSAKALGLTDDECPDFCIGSSDFHTPLKLRDLLQSKLKKAGYKVEINSPYEGSITPMCYYRTDKRVKSIMIEVNKRLYLDESLKNKTPDFDKIKRVCSEIIRLFRYEYDI